MSATDTFFNGCGAIEEPLSVGTICAIMQGKFCGLDEASFLEGSSREGFCFGWISEVFGRYPSVHLHVTPLSPGCPQQATMQRCTLIHFNKF